MTTPITPVRDWIRFAEAIEKKKETRMELPEFV